MNNKIAMIKSKSALRQTDKEVLLVHNGKKVSVSLGGHWENSRRR